MALIITECPRDAMQGFHRTIPTEQKIQYCNALLKVGYDMIDIGSFVSVRAVPQMSDTSEVLKSIDTVPPQTKLLTIIANERGAETACGFSNVDIIGFPFSISETFQMRNTRQTLPEAFERLKNLVQMTSDASKQLLVYLSMGFGNPYGDHWSPELAGEWCKKIEALGVAYVNLSDTTGTATAEGITQVFTSCRTHAPLLELGAHLHTRPDNWKQNLHAAYLSGCRKFDAAIKGYGGCPFAADRLTGNLPTELLLQYATDAGESLRIDKPAFDKAMQLSSAVFA